MRRNKQGFLPSDERLSRILSLLILPVAAALFGILSGACGNMLSESIKTVIAQGQQHSSFRIILNALALVCLLALLVLHMLNTLRMFRGTMAAVLAAALVFSPLALLFPHSGTAPAAAWLAELVFLLFAAQTTLQISLLPPDMRYKNASLRTLLLLILTGGFAVVNQAKGLGWDILISYAALVGIYLVLHIVCLRKQRGIRLLQIALDDSAMAGNLKLTLGPEGIRQLLPYFRLQMREGSSVARLLILELMRGAEFDGKEDLARAAFDSGPLEVRFAVVDQIFGWSLPYSLLSYAVAHCDASLAEYLVRKIFLNYSDAADHGALEALQAQAGCMRRYALTEETKRMFGYVFDGRREEYACILDGLLRSDRKEDRLFAAEIMAAYVGREDNINRRYLTEVIENTILNPAELEEMIELCAEYDSDMGVLKKHLSNYYSYEFLKKICEYYEPVSIAKSFSGVGHPVPVALTLLAACRLDKSGMGVYHGRFDQLMDYIVRLSCEENKILAEGFSNGKLLTDEIKNLRLTLMAAALEYRLMEESGVRTENALEEIKQVLEDGGMQRMTLWGNAGESLRKLLSGELPVSGDFDYSVLKVSENNTFLESIYRYLGGEAMDTKLTENIEKLIALKSIPMFSDLDIFTLQQIQKISVYKKIPVGETVITEGEEGTSLYVVIGGKAGVYKGSKFINEIGTGGLLGEMAIIEKQRRSATIKTLEETSFLVIDGDDFMKLLERNSSVSVSVIKTLACRLRKMLEEGK